VLGIELAGDLGSRSVQQSHVDWLFCNALFSSVLRDRMCPFVHWLAATLLDASLVGVSIQAGVGDLLYSGQPPPG